MVPTWKNEGKIMSDVEKSVRDFYEQFGWVTRDGAPGENLFRQFSQPYFPYHQAVDARTAACFSNLSGKLLLAGGGDLPESHTTIAGQFSDVCCLDISRRALDIAETKLRSKAQYVLGSILDIPLPDDYFDAAYCAHVIFHIDIDLQEKAIEELIRVTKPGGRVVVIYANPDSLVDRIAESKRKLPLLWRLRRKSESSSEGSTESARSRPPLYFALHSLRWWQRFDSKCRVSLIPWDVMSSAQEKVLLWSDGMAAVVYRICGWLERKHPALALRWWKYPVIVLEKRPADGKFKRRHRPPQNYCGKVGQLKMFLLHLLSC